MRAPCRGRPENGGQTAAARCEEEKSIQLLCATLLNPRSPDDGRDARHAHLPTSLRKRIAQLAGTASVNEHFHRRRDVIVGVVAALHSARHGTSKSFAAPTSVGRG